LTSYEKEVDIDNKLKNYLKINMFRPQKTLKTTRIKLYHKIALPAPFYSSENYSKRCKKKNSSKYEGYEKNTRIHLDRLYNKQRDVKITKYNSSFGQNTE